MCLPCGSYVFCDRFCVIYAVVYQFATICRSCGTHLSSILKKKFSDYLPHLPASWSVASFFLTHDSLLVYEFQSSQLKTMPANSDAFMHAFRRMNSLTWESSRQQCVLEFSTNDPQVREHFNCTFCVSVSQSASYHSNIPNIQLIL